MARIAPQRTVCWTPLWNAARPGTGLEHLLLRDGQADSVVLAIDPQRGPFRLAYRLTWDAAWQLREAQLQVTTAQGERSLLLKTAPPGLWRDGQDRPLPALDGCDDIDIWPSPFTNTFPIRRLPWAVGERREIRVAWVGAPDLDLRAQSQAYTRLASQRYRFESLDGSGFQADLPVDEDGLVTDYPGLFRRVRDDATR